MDRYLVSKIERGWKFTFQSNLSIVVNCHFQLNHIQNEYECSIDISTSRFEMILQNEIYGTLMVVIIMFSWH